METIKTRQGSNQMTSDDDETPFPLPSMRVRTCRLCGETAWVHKLIKYSTRAYAHPFCFYALKGGPDIEELPAYPRKKFDEWYAHYLKTGEIGL